LSGDFVSIATKCIAWRPVSRPKTNVCPSSAPSDLLAPNLQLVRRLVRRSFSEGVSPNPPIPQSPNPPIPQSPFPFLPSSFQSPPAFNISAFPHLPRTSQQQSREAKPFTRPLSTNRVRRSLLRDLPKSNHDWWKAKIEGNQPRDLRNESSLRKLGWHVVTIWECALKPQSDRAWLEIRNLASLIHHFALPNPIPSSHFSCG
jgi:hypothetical protein